MPLASRSSGPPPPRPAGAPEPDAHAGPASAVPAIASGAAYADPAYARSLAEFGEPLELPRSGGQLLVRPIGDGEQRDAMGTYPLFACRDWTALSADLDELAAAGDLASVTVVADPFGAHSAALLARAFGDLARPFKRHWAVDLSAPLDQGLSTHHRRSVRRALRHITVERCERPAEHLDDWCALYGELVERHAIRGVAAFSRAAFARQLALPGLAAWRAVLGGRTVGMLLWLRAGDVAYYHLGAHDAAGYEHKGSYALMHRALGELAAAGVRWASLGGGAGALGPNEEAEHAAKPGSGLDFFKAGWANVERVAWLCGRVLDRAAYAELCARRPAGGSYFPLYREGEFAPGGRT